MAALQRAAVDGEAVVNGLFIRGSTPAQTETRPYACFFSRLVPFFPAKSWATQHSEPVPLAAQIDRGASDVLSIDRCRRQTNTVHALDRMMPTDRADNGCFVIRVRWFQLFYLLHFGILARMQIVKRRNSIG